MRVLYAFFATLILIALGVWQMRSRAESNGRDFVIIVIIATIVMLGNAF